MESLSHYKVLYIPGGDLENFWSINVVWRTKAIWSIVSAVFSVTIRWKNFGAGAEFSGWKRATAKSVVIINESSKLKKKVWGGVFLGFSYIPGTLNDNA